MKVVSAGIKGGEDKREGKTHEEKVKHKIPEPMEVKGGADIELKSRAIEILKFCKNKSNLKYVIENEEKVWKEKGGEYKQKLEWMSGSKFTSFSKLFSAMRDTLIQAGVKAEELKHFEENVADVILEEMDNEDVGLKIVGRCSAAIISGESGEKEIAKRVVEKGIENEIGIGGCADILLEVLRLGRVENIKWAEKLILGNIDCFGRGLKDESSTRACADALAFAVYSGGKEKKERAFKYLERGMENEVSIKDCARVLAYLRSTLRTIEERKRVFTPITNFISRVNLEEGKIIDAWKRSIPSAMFSEIVGRNIYTLKKLEDERPGAAKILYKKFGIADFGRYRVEMLIRQYDEIKETKKPYGIVLYPRDDNNGAFYESSEILNKVSMELKEKGFALRIIECESKQNIARRLIAMNKEYGKMLFAIVGGHGTEDSIVFGGEGKEHKLYKEDLLGRGVRRSSKFFVDNPTIILISCLTGAEGGIAQKLSRIWSARVIAPEAETYIKEIHVDVKNGKPIFDVKYEDDVGKTYIARFPTGKYNIT